MRMKLVGLNDYGYDPERPLSLKEQNLMQNLLNGIPDADALEQAGYSRKSKIMILRIRPIVMAALKKRQNQIIDETISKGQCVSILKTIALNDKAKEGARISAIALLSRLLGYEEPIKQQITSQNEQLFSIKVVEDHIIEHKTLKEAARMLEIGKSEDT